MPSRRFRPGGADEPQEPLDAARARQRALTLLARRDFTAKQLADRLEQDGAAPDVAGEVIAGLARDGVVDDRRVAAAMARRSLVIRRRGRLRALRELTDAGLDAAVAREAVEATLAGEDEAALIDRAVERYARGPLTDPRAVRRAHAALLRQGFPAAAIRAALSRRRAADVGELPDEP
jgi:regulatory protein